MSIDLNILKLPLWQGSGGMEYANLAYVPLNPRKHAIMRREFRRELARHFIQINVGNYPSGREEGYVPPSAINQLRVEDVSFSSTGYDAFPLELEIRPPRLGRRGRRRTVKGVYSPLPASCAARRLMAWLAGEGITEGYVFQGINPKTGKLTGKLISNDEVKEFRQWFSRMQNAGWIEMMEAQQLL